MVRLSLASSNGVFAASVLVIAIASLLTILIFEIEFKWQLETFQ